MNRNAPGRFWSAPTRLLPDAGVSLTTLAAAVETLGVAGPVELPPGSWGAGKDYRVWDGEPVRDLRDEGFWVQRRLLDVVDRERRAGRLGSRRPDLDQLARQALLTLSSDWAFMVTRQQAAGYARERAAVASILGYGPGHSDEMVNDYLRTTRRARAVVDRVFWE